MNQVAVITDIHFGVRGDSSYMLDQYEQFFERIFFPTLESENINTLLILGDVWDRRKHTNVNTRYRAMQMLFEPLKARGIETYIIYGNHDVFYRDTNSVNELDYLGLAYDNVTIIDKPLVLELGNTRFGMVPWINAENESESMEFIRSRCCDILCGHFEIEGFEMTPGVVCREGLTHKQLKGYEHVLTGHFHNRSTYGNITYIGNPFQTTWNDYQKQKGFAIVDCNDRSLKFIDNPNEVFLKHYYSEDIDLAHFDFSQFQNKVLKVFVSLKDLTNRNRFELFLSELSLVTKQYTVVELETDSSEESERIEQIEDTNEMVHNYFDALDLGALDANRLKTLFSDLMKESYDNLSHNQV